MRGRTLVTGADGYVGRNIVAALLAEGDDELVLCLHATNRDELSAKRARLEHRLGGTLERRVSVTAADLGGKDVFCDVDPDTVTRVVHTAAVTRFNVDMETARSVNLVGTAQVCEFALKCQNLQRLALISTLYAAGEHRGVVAEAPLDDVGFVNHYEWSKWSAESHALRECRDLPLSILRLPTIVADDASGAVTQYNAFHNTLKLFFYGLLSLLPGDPATPLNMATVSFVTAAVSRLISPDAPGGIYNICTEPARTATLGSLIDASFDVFERDERFRRRKLLRPLYCDRESFDDLAQAAEHLPAGPLKESMRSVAPFGAQLYMPKSFANDALRAAWPDYCPEDQTALAEATCSHLVATRWGREPKDHE